MTFDLKINFPPIPTCPGGKFKGLGTGDRDCANGEWLTPDVDEGGGGGCSITGEEDMMTAGEDDNGGLPGRAAKYFATISTTPVHWVPSSGILKALQRGRKKRLIV